jgi:hypothetical protein
MLLTHNKLVLLYNLDRIKMIGTVAVIADYSAPEKRLTGYDLGDLDELLQHGIIEATPKASEYSGLIYRLTLKGKALIYESEETDGDA